MPTGAATLCDECGSALTGDPRFVRWCRSCGWNAHPKPARDAKRPDRFRRRPRREAEERLLSRITEQGTCRRPPDAAAVGAWTLSGLIHLVTFGLAGGGAFMLFQHPWPLRVAGAGMLAVAYAVRPRLGPGRLARRGPRSVERDAAPALYGLADRVARELRAAPPASIVVNGSYRASWSRTGLRRRVVLTVGLALWETLTPAERVALLGHELAHGAAGARHGWWVGSAAGTLNEWYGLFRPGAKRESHGHRGSSAIGLAVIGELIATVVLAVFAETVLLAHRLLSRLTTRAGRRAEYHADALAARVAGRDAVAGLLGALCLGGTDEQVTLWRRLGRDLARSVPDGAGAGAASDFWSDLRRYVASIPDSERERRLLVARLDNCAVDAAHPPTHLRLAFVDRLPDHAATIGLTAEESAGLDRELAAVRAAVAADLG